MYKIGNNTIFFDKKKGIFTVDAKGNVIQKSNGVKEHGYRNKKEKI